MRRTPGHGAKLSYYGFGRTTLFACQADQRFSYCLAVPDAYDEAGTETYPLVVVVHGTDRTAQEYRDRFADFAEAEQAIILAPLFPAGIGEPGDLSGYKFIAAHGIRYDLVLLAMVDEVASSYRIAADRFLLHGFSGGGHFAHRFFYLQPHRLLAISIGAPGLVTLLDPTRDWWVGIRDLETRFGHPLDRPALRKVPVQLVIGGDDTDTWEITLEPGGRYWLPGANDAGRTRLDRLESLRRSFEASGIAVRHDVVPGVGHQGFAILDPVKAFFADILHQRGRPASTPTAKGAAR